MQQWITRIGLFAALGFVVLCQSVSAIPVDPVTLTGSRDVTVGGITGSGAYATSFKISWNITPGDGEVLYTYKLENLTKDLSHLIIEVSPNFTDEDISDVSGIEMDDDGVRWFGPDYPGNSSNPGLVSNIFGIKFEEGPNGSTVEFSFTSTRMPMWGDFYAKDGRSGGTNVYAFNNGLNNPDLTDIINFIAVPDTVGPDDDDDDEEPTIPEPASLALVGLGLASAGLIRRRRNR